MSMVSVSRLAGAPQRGQVVRTHSSSRASGERPSSVGLKSSRSGRSTGSCSTGMGTMPHDLAVDDGDGHAPVALAADQPVAQLEVDLLARQATLAQPGHDGRERLAGRRQTVEPTGVDHDPVARVGLAERALRAVGRRDHLDDRQAVLGGELEVALVVPRYGHDGAGAVGHEHVVARSRWGSSRR